jgi:hypothetical protein
MRLVKERLLCTAVTLTLLGLAAPAPGQVCETVADCEDACGVACEGGQCVQHTCVELLCGTPTITCPGDLTLAAPAGAGSALVTYASPTSSPISGDPCFQSLSCSPASGSSFPTGETTVTCRVTQVDNSQASCTFLLTLNATPIPVFSSAGTAAMTILVAAAGVFALLRRPA